MGDQPGPLFDNGVRLWTVEQRADLCRWVGLKVENDGIAEPEELPAHGQRVDLLARIGEDRLAQIEFFRRTDSTIGPRMAEYLVRLWRRYPGCTIEQHVIVMGEGRLDEEFRRDGLTLRFRVHLLRESDPASMLEVPATMPLAVLAKCAKGQRRERLRQVIGTIARSGDPNMGTLIEMAETFARVHLPADVVRSVGREARMPFDLREFPPSPAVEEAYEHGLTEGEARGEARSGTRIFSILLRSRFRDDPRIDRIAARLAEGDPEQAFEAASTAPSLDALDS